MRTKISVALGVILLSIPALAGSGNSPLAAAKFDVLPLVSDQPGVAPNTDPDLVNAWGISHAPGGPNWVSDNGTDKATIYDRNTGAKSSPVVEIPHGAPTGTVYVPPGIGFEIKRTARVPRPRFCSIPNPERSKDRTTSSMSTMPSLRSTTRRMARSTRVSLSTPSGSSCSPPISRIIRFRFSTINSSSSAASPTSDCRSALHRST